MTIVTYKSFDNETIIEMCKSNDRKAWDEFFRRFTPTIKKAIHSVLDPVNYRKTLYIAEINSLKSSQDSKQGDDQITIQTVSCEDDSTEEVFVEVVIKLYTGALCYLRDPSGILAWLITVAQNEAKDWLDHHNTIKNAPNNEAEGNSVSIDDQLENSEMRLEEVLIPSPDCRHNDERSEANLDSKKNRLLQIQEKLQALPKDKGYWLHRISIIAESDFDQQEIMELAGFTKQPVSAIKLKLKTAREEAFLKITKLEKHLKRSAELTSELRKIEGKQYRSEGFFSNDQLKELEDRHIEKEIIRDNHIEDFKKNCRPSDKTIADILNFSKKEEKQVSSMLGRYRKKFYVNEITIDTQKIDAGNKR